jgi:hypothetical protein
VDLNQLFFAHQLAVMHTGVCRHQASDQLPTITFAALDWQLLSGMGILFGRSERLGLGRELPFSLG